jgi:transposase-like protein
MECGYAIPPAEILRTGWHRMRCPKCGKDFTVESKAAGVS